MNETCYFAYGSNMNPERVASRGLTVTEIKPARVSGLGLTFDKQSADHAGEGHAALRYDRAGAVEGVLYRLGDFADILKMDVFEATPVNYSRERIIVESRGRPAVAWTYYVNPAVTVVGGIPSRDYLAHLLAGKPYLSSEYHAWLTRHACLEATR